MEAVHDILQMVVDPVSFMADALEVENNDGVGIDFTLEKIFKSNRPMNFHLLKASAGGPPNGLAPMISAGMHDVFFWLLFFFF